MESGSSAPCKEISQGSRVAVLHTWKLTSDLFVGQAFAMRLQKSSQQMLGNSQEYSIRECGLDFSIDNVDGILLHARPL